jgi:Tse3 toxin immunity protein Tsi3
MFKPVESSDKRAPLLLLAVCALLCAGCARYEAPPQMKIVKESQHANGLTVGVPEGFEAKQTEDGFAVEPSGNKNLEVRYPVVASVSLVKGADAPDEPGLQTKSVGAREVRYRITKSEGGSGGETYVLKVLERVPGGRHLEYSQSMQSEVGEPDFALCWTLVGSTKYKETR